MTKYDYPKTIAEAAKILDTALPGWENDIKIQKLDMKGYRTCILGQLYEEYEYGMEEFGWDRCVDGRLHNGIFGTTASINDWTKEIESRLNATKTLDFPTALQAVKEGKKVKVVGREQTLERIEDKLVTKNHGIEYSITLFFDLYNFKYEIVAKPLTFADLKVGEKFCSPLARCTKIEKLKVDGYEYNAVNEKHQLVWCKDSLVVTRP